MHTPPHNSLPTINEGNQPQAPAVQTLDLATISFSDAAAIAELSQAAWPYPGASPEASARQTLQGQAAGEYPGGTYLWSVIRCDGQIVAAAETFPREVLVSGQPLTVLALAGVTTLAEHRGHGYASAAVTAGFRRVQDGQFAFALFQTSHRNRPFYERLGAGVVPDTAITNSLDPGAKGASPFWDQIVMYYPASQPWPAGPIDTLGPGW